jgi:hypothetical protein
MATRAVLLLLIHAPMADARSRDDRLTPSAWRARLAAPALPARARKPRPALRPVLVVLHQEHSTPGRVGRLLQARGHALDIRKPRYRRRRCRRRCATMPAR